METKIFKRGSAKYLLRKYSLVGILSALLLIVVLFLPTYVIASVIVSPQVDIFVGPDDQGRMGLSAAFDSTNNRFLVVWSDEWIGGGGDKKGNVYGQIVNSDGTLYGTPIAICTSGNSNHGTTFEVSFDSTNGRFLVVWSDYRNVYYINVYGQLVNADGSLYGDNFPISPIPPASHNALVAQVKFDSVNGRFLVIWVRGSGALPYNICGQFVNPDGSLYGPFIQFTNFTADYYMAFPRIEFDPNNVRFLLTWANQYDGYIYGRLINADGTFYGSEITIGQYCLGCSYLPSLSFDPINSRFIQTWWKSGIRGQLINTDGILFGSELNISPPGSITANKSVVFDAANKKFLVAGRIESPYNGFFGQFLNPDGSLYGTDFLINPSMNGRLTLVASSSMQTGSLIAYKVDYLTLGDIFGNFITLIDIDGPSLSIASHTDGQHVTTSSIALSGTASDSGRGDNGIQQVTVNESRADNDTTTGSGTANWSKVVNLSPGANAITVIAYDDSANNNQTSLPPITITYDVPGVPDISVSPALLTFGQVVVGSTSTPRTATISNTGTANLVISSIQTTGTDAGMFSVAPGGLNPCPSLTPTIAPDGNCTVNVTFSPTSKAQKTAALSISSDDPDENPVNVSLSGTGVIVKLTRPNGGEPPWKSGAIETITWDTTNPPPSQVAKFRLRRTINGGTTWVTIVTRLGNPGRYDWKVPAVASLKKRCKIKVVLLDSLGSIIGSDMSDKVFTIQP